MSPREIIDWTLRESGYGDLATLEAERWLDLQPAFEEGHFLNGFGFSDGKFRFKADWMDAPVANDGLHGPWREMPNLPDHWPINEDANEDHPFKLATSPARNFLNSSFTETPTSRSRELRPEVLMNPSDATRLELAQGDVVQLGNERGRTRLHVRIFGGVESGSPRQRRRLASLGLSRRMGNQRAGRRRQRRSARGRGVS